MDFDLESASLSRTMGASPRPMQVISAFHTLQTILVELLPVLLVNDILKAMGNVPIALIQLPLESIFLDWDDGDGGSIPQSGR